MVMIMASNKPKKLTKREMLFCFCYSKLQNSKEAAIKAGYLQNNAEIQSQRLLLRADINEQIQLYQRQAQSDELMQVIIAGLKRLAFSNSNDSLKLVFKDRDELQKAIDTLDLFHIAEIKIPKDNALEIKFFDRFKALEKLIELMQADSGKQETNEFYKAFEAGAKKLSSDCQARGKTDEIQGVQ